MNELSGETGPWGTLCWSIRDQSGTYAITDEDVLWGCRMVVGEDARDALKVLQCMANRFAFLYHKGYWDTLTELFQAYSQPINPIWRRDGSKCKDRIGSSGCELHRLDRRDRLASASLSTLRSTANTNINNRGVSQALRFFRGEMTQEDLEVTHRVTGAVHFAVRNIIVHKHGRGNADSPDIIKGNHNWFARVPMTRGWSNEDVVILNPAGAKPSPSAFEREPDTEEIALRLQTKLKDMGFYDGALDGKWGRRSRNAMTNFESAVDYAYGLYFSIRDDV